MQLTVLSARDLDGLVSMASASAAMKTAFAALATGQAVAPPRAHVDVPDVSGKALLMGAYVPGLGLASKVVSYFPENRRRGLRAVNGLILVLDERTGVPRALCDGTSLTALRTGAGTCAAIELLARSDTTCGALFGSGGQAPMQLLAMDTARSLSRIWIVTPRPEEGRRFIAEMQPRVHAALELAATPREAVRDADVVVAATSSATPVFDGDDLKPGAHVVGIGSITPRMREVDATTVRRARIFVDSFSGVDVEAGELIHGVESGLTRRDAWTELGRVAAGLAPGRQRDDEITYYKSVGHAVQDVAIAQLALERAAALGLGTSIEI